MRRTVSQVSHVCRDTTSDIRLGRPPGQVIAASAAVLCPGGTPAACGGTGYGCTAADAAATGPGRTPEGTVTPSGS